MRAPGTPSFGPFLLAAALLSPGCVATPRQKRTALPPRMKESDEKFTHTEEAAPAPAAVPAPPVWLLLEAAETLISKRRLDDAVEAATKAAELDPENSRPWLLRARSERRLAAAATDAADGTTARLRLVDADTSSLKAVALGPKDPEAWRERGRVLRDSSKFMDAAAAFQKALDLAGPDGDTLYDLGYCLAYARDFRGGLAAFEDAEKALGPQLRITLNAATCEERLGNRAAATERLARHYDTECAAGRAAGADAKRLLEKTWELTVMKMDYDAGKAALARIEKAHPDRPEPSFMLGNLHAFLGDQAAAALAYGRSLAAAPRPATRLRFATACAAAGRSTDAQKAVSEALEKHPEFEGTRDAALLVGRALLAGQQLTPARALAASALEKFPDDSDFLLLAGDASMAQGDPMEAEHAYAAAQASSSLSSEPPSRRAKAEFAAIRGGKAELDAPGKFDAPAAALDPVPAGEPLVDFEDARVFVRPLGGTRIVEGSIRFPAPEPGGSRRVALHFFPDLDATRWSHVDLRLRSEGGAPGDSSGSRWEPDPGVAAGLHVEMADGMDQMSDLPAGRLRWPAPGVRAPLGDAWTAVAVPLREFEMTDDKRPIPAALARVKCLVLDVKADDGKAPIHLGIDSIALRDKRSGRTLLLQDFDEGIVETAVTFEGTTPPFTRHVADVAMIRDVLPTGTGPISKGIVEGQNGTFDAAMVGRGVGALRVRHGDSGWFPSKKGVEGGTSTFSADGPGGVRVALNPDRDLQRFGALTFLARGEAGGEKLRVLLRDHHDLTIGKDLEPSRWPRSYWPRTEKEEGAATLTKEWRMYRIPFGKYPEIDRGAMAEISFEIGSEVGNPPGATVYLDEIGLEY